MTQRRPRKYVLGALGAPLFALAPGSQRIARAAESYTLRLNHTVAANSVPGLVSTRFAQSVERRSNGQVKIEVYPNGQLAKERETIDGLVNGVIDFANFGSTFLEPLFPRFQAFDVPFLFKDLASAYRVLDGPIGNEFFSDLETKGIVGLGWGDNGFKEMETIKTVAVPADMKGLRMRIQGSAIYTAMYQALGAIPVTIDLTEVLTGLSQHTVDGTDVSLDNFTMNKWYTAIKHVANTNHLLSINPLMGSKRKIETLPAPLQRIVREEGKAVIPYWRSLTAPKLADAIAFLKQNGVAFNEVQFQDFRKAMDPVYALVQSKVGGDLIDRIGRAAIAAGT